jgi:hypothetical protein
MAARATVAGAAAVLFGCAVRQPSDPEADVAAVLSLLRNGELKAAAERATSARQRQPDHGGLAICAATVADLLWRDDVAVAELRVAAASADRGGWSTAEARGRLGDQLFLAGRFGEAIVPLLAGAVDDAAARRRAWIAAARELPYRRKPVGVVATEQPLLEGRLPEFLCGLGAARRVFTIDTGSSMTTISRTLAKAANVRAQSDAGEMPDGTGQAIAVQMAVLDAFSIGDVWLGTVPVLVVDDERLSMRDLFGGPERAPEGVLGLDLMSLFRMTLDPVRRNVVLEHPRGLPETDSVQCVRADGRCLLPVAIEGCSLWFVLDTGASHSSLTQEGLLALPGGSARAVPGFRRVRTAGGGTFSVREIRNLVLRTSKVRFPGVDLPIVPRRAGGLFPVHGVLGVDLLEQCRVTLDQGRARLERAS